MPRVDAAGAAYYVGSRPVVALCAGAAQVWPPPGAELGERKLIKHGQDLPDAAWFAANAERAASRPFDGATVYIPDATDDVFKVGGEVAENAVAEAVADFHTADLGGLQHNLALLRFVSEAEEQPDWWDDEHWEGICERAAAFAAGVQGANIQGIAIDNEHYHETGSYLFDWQEGAGIDPSHTLEQSQAKVRQRGREFMEAVLAEWPDVEVYVFHGPYISDPRTGVEVWTSEPAWNVIDFANELSAWWFFGLLDAIRGTDATLYSGGEVYNIRSEEAVQAVRDWQLNGLPSGDTIVPSELRGLAWRKVRAGQMVGDFDMLDDFALQDAEDIRDQVHWSMLHNDRVIYYSEKHEWWTGETWAGHIDIDLGSEDDYWNAVAFGRARGKGLEDPEPRVTPPEEPNASGIPLPQDDVDGWSLVLAEDFNTPMAVGGVDGPTGVFSPPYSTTVYAFVDGTPDTANNTNNPPAAAGIYQPSQTVSIADSCLTVDAVVDSGVPKAASIVVLNPNTLWGQSYGRYQVCFRVVTPNTGWKLAYLLWPDSQSWPNDGEIDFPEGSLTGTIQANTHHDGDSTDDYDHFESGAFFGTDVWHVATIEWAPGYVRYTLEDDRVVGTSWATIPDGPMHWVLQFETDVGIAQPTLGAKVEVDWVALWEIDDFEVPTPPKTSTLVDDFTELDRFVWITPNGTHSSGGVSIPQTLLYDGMLHSVERYDLTSSVLAVRVVPDTVNSSTSNWFLVSDTNVPPSQFNFRNELSFNKEGSNLVLGYRTNGTLNSTSITYNSTTHAWWRLACDGTNVYWQTSPTGESGSWTTRRTVALATIGWAPDEVQVQFGCGYWNTGAGTPSAMRVEEVNTGTSTS